MFTSGDYPIAVPKRTLALTFDDGPGPNTPELARFLRDLRVPATFFMVGRHVEKRPEAARSVRAMGHQIGNHSYSHEDLSALAASPERIVDQVLRAHGLLQGLQARGPLLFRAPYGRWPPGAAEVLNARPELRRYAGPVGWDLEFADYEIGGPRGLVEGNPTYTLEECRERCLEGMVARGRGIVVLHDWAADAGDLGERLRRNNRTLELVRWLVPRLGGFRFVSVADLLPSGRTDRRAPRGPGGRRSRA